MKYGKSTGKNWTIFKPLLWRGSWKGYLALKFLAVKNYFFIQFFVNVLSYEGERLQFFKVPKSRKYSSKIENGPKHRHFLPSCELTPVFGSFWGSTKTFSGLFQSCLSVVRKYSGFMFGLGKPHFWLQFQLERLINDPENKNVRSKFCSILRFFAIIFEHFGAQDSRFLNFFKVVFELFKKCYGIVIDHKMPTFGCFFSSKC